MFGSFVPQNYSDNLIWQMHSKAFFATIVVSNAATSLNSSGLWGGRAHACARAHASEKLRATKFGIRRDPYLGKN